MESYPNNSQRKVSTPPKKDPKDKKIEKVIDSEPIRRKKPFGKKFTETMVSGDDAGSVWGYILYDVLVPAAKDMISEAVSQGVERLLFGETTRRPSARSGGQRSNVVSYNRISTQAARREEPRQQLSRRSRASHDFDEIVLNSRAEADEVIQAMYDLLSTYDVVSVADLYELVGQTPSYTDEKWGWTSLRGSGVTRVKGGYLLDLPKTELLD